MNADFAKRDRDMVLVSANFIGVNLHKADLCDSNFRYADMREANLSAAKLLGTDLSDANLCGADLSDIEINEKTSFRFAKYDHKTVFPAGFDPDEHGVEKRRVK